MSSSAPTLAVDPPSSVVSVASASALTPSTLQRRRSSGQGAEAEAGRQERIDEEAHDVERIEAARALGVVSHDG